MSLDTVVANVKYIKESYPKQTRVELISSLLELESNNSQSEKVENLHKMLDQIFSVILKNLEWNMSATFEKWDYRPIDVMIKVFPKIEKTIWYNLRHKQVIDQLKKR
jgi:DNA-binding ferritin-like protein